MKKGIASVSLLLFAALVAAQVPDEARKMLAQELQGPFLVLHDKAQVELKLSDKQKEKLLEKVSEHLPEIMQGFEKIKDAKGQEREKMMQEHRRKWHEKLTAALKDVLDAKQQERLGQLSLQQEGLFAALGESEAFKKLNITDEQRKQFMGVVQEMQKKIIPLIKEAESGGNPQEIRPKIMKIRKDHEGKIEALLTNAQKKQWHEMIGKPFTLDD